MDGKELLEHISDLRDNLQKYLETKMSYYGMVAFEKAVRLLSLLMAQVVVLMAALLGLLFLSGAAAIYLGGLMGSLVWGMLVVGGFYVLMTFVLFAWRRSVFSRWAIRTLKGIFFSDDDSESKATGG